MNKILIRAGVWSALVGLFIVSGSVFANGEGGSVGGGGSTGCAKPGWTMDTCYGATWRWYSTTSNTVTIKGKSAGHEYASSGTISGCADAGGYWRYAMVAYNTGYYSDGTTYSAGDQVGMIGIDANSSNTYDSEFFGGGMNYIGSNWDYVKQKYEEAQKHWPSVFVKGFAAGSNLSWFCARDPDLPDLEYYTSSNASATGTMTGSSAVTRSAATGVSSSKKNATSTELNLRVGDSLSNLQFYHNVYASDEAETQAIKITRTVSGALNRNGFNNATSYYTIQYDSSTSGTYYAANDVYGATDIKTATGSTPGYRVSSSPFAQDKYKNVRFTIAGTYNFCETIYLNTDGSGYKEYTSACIKVVVGAKTNYRAESNVLCKSGYQGTGIQAGKKTVTDECSIKVNETIPVIFSHNAYATQSSNNVAWRVNRTSGSGSGMTGSGYSISYPKGSNESANGSSATVLRTTNMTTAYSRDSFSGYIADTRPYTDGSSNFVHRDYYNIKFTVAGTYYLCETISVGGTELTTGCAKVVVEGGGPDVGDCSAWAPESFASSGVNYGTTSIRSAVKNADAGFNSWAVSNGVSETAFAANAVYAKPGDTVSWSHCYYPGVQTTASTIVTKNNSHPHPSTLAGNVNTLDNVAISSFGTWNNYFNVSQSNMLSANAHSSGALGTGMSDAKKWDNTYEVETGSRSRAGMSLTEQGMTSAPISVSIGSPEWHSWNCNAYDCDPYDCNCSTDCDDEGSCTTTCDTCYRTCYETCYHDKNYISNSRTNSTASDKAMVKVPYNFVNTTTVALKETAIQGATGTGKIVYAGETVAVDAARVTVSPRYNSVTKGTYATRVAGAEVRLIAYTSRTNTGSALVDYGTYSSDLCSAISSRVAYGNCTTDEYYGSGRSGYLNYTEDTSGKEETKFAGVTYNVYDIPAGEYYCVVAAVYPYTVSSNTEMSRYGSDSWYVSEPDCSVVAKKPSMAVTGSGLYTAKNIMTTSPTKNNVHGFYDYTPKSKTNVTVFGSWVEQAVVVPVGRVSGLASGAATAYYSSNGNTRTPLAGLGGSKEGTSINYCYRVPLTISNSNCTGTMQQAGGYGSTATTKPKDKAALIDRYVGEDSEGVEYEKVGDYTFATTTIPKGVTRVLESTGTVTISGDIKYTDGYSDLAEVPKLIIYARNITISCSVGRIDAILIAEENINTCPTTDINARANSKQLIINGAVISNTLTLNRTYGAATGANSVVPAEIINYDSTLYLWGEAQAEADQSGKLNITYQRELSPRY